MSIKSEEREKIFLLRVTGGLSVTSASRPSSNSSFKKSLSDRAGKSTLRTIREYFSDKSIPTEHITNIAFNSLKWGVSDNAWDSNSDSDNNQIEFIDESPQRVILEAKARNDNEAAVELAALNLKDLDDLLEANESDNN